MHKITFVEDDVRKKLTKKILVPWDIPGVLGVSISKSPQSMILKMMFPGNIDPI